MELPKPGEYAEYYSVYLKQIPDADNIITVLEKSRDDMQRLISSIPEEKGSYSYQPGKWSIKEVFGHIADVERVMTYRSLCIARGEKQHLPGFEQDDYVKAADFNRRPLSSLAEELLHLRNSGLALFRTYDEDACMRWGIVNNHDVTARAYMYIIAGHEIHHMRILKERYL
jgi:arsenate reductase-like glutaredoxin family protein